MVKVVGNGEVVWRRGLPGEPRGEATLEQAYLAAVEQEGREARRRPPHERPLHELMAEIYGQRVRDAYLRGWRLEADKEAGR